MDNTTVGTARTDPDPRPAGAGLHRDSGWAIVPHNCTAAFAVRNFGVHTVHGVVPVVDASVTADVGAVGASAVDPGGAADLPQVSGVRIAMNLAGIDTANKRRDKDLRGAHLLDTENHPDLVFECTNVRGGPPGWKLDGTVTARGTSAPVTVDAVLISGPVRDHITVRATTSIDRRSLGIRVPRLMIGHRVEVEVSAVFRRVSAGR